MHDLRLSGFDDWDEFSDARDLLLDRFVEWLSDRDGMDDNAAPDLAGDVALALDWKFNYSDGELGRWHTSDVYEFLIEWCPRKVSIAPDECGSIPGAIGSFAGFLEANGLLAADSSPVTRLAAAAESLTDRFVTAMGDPSNFGLAKSFFGAAVAAGVDMSDEEALQGWVEEFNSRPFEEREAIIPDSALSFGRAPRMPSLPPVPIPDDAEVAASKADAPIVAMLAAFAEYVGEGRKLTAKGNLSLADARALIERLGTGDVMDETIGDHTFKTVSSAELPRLRQIFAWARKAGIVRVAHGKVIATKRGLAVRKDPAGTYDRAVDALLEIGPLSSLRNPDSWLAWPEIWEFLDELCVHLLVGPYVAGRPVPLEQMTEVAASAVLDAFEFPDPRNDDRINHKIAVDVTDLTDVLELAGMVRRLDLDDSEPEAALPGRRRPGGSLELTAAGLVAVRQRLADLGYETPSAGRFADYTATELLLNLDIDDPFEFVIGEMMAWQKKREPKQAAAELAVAVVELADPALQNMALSAMSAIGVDIAAPEVRKLADNPAVRGFALCWLVDFELEDPSVLYDPADVSWFVDVLAHRLVVHGQDALCDTLSLAGGNDQQIEVIKRIWRSPSSSTDTVLDGLGDLHPAKPVAKAARKARLQRRSWLANQG